MLILNLFIALLLTAAEVVLLWDLFKSRMTAEKPKPELPGKGITLMVPFRTDNGVRARTWEWLEKYWKAALPGAEIVIGTDDQTPFCKTAAVNRAFRKSHGDIVIILDADCFIDYKVILNCADRIRKARLEDKKIWFIPYRRFYRLTAGASELILRSDPTDPYFPPQPPPHADLDSTRGISSGHWYGALIQIMPREAFIRAGFMDERFAGWGGEDVAFMRAIDTLYGKHKTSANGTFHLWHPSTRGYDDDTRVWNGQDDPAANWPLATKYGLAFGDRAAMRELVSGNTND